MHFQSTPLSPFAIAPFSAGANQPVWPELHYNVEQSGKSNVCFTLCP